MTGVDRSNAYGRHAKVRLRHGGKWHAEHDPQFIEKPCGSWLASDGVTTSGIDGGWSTAIAGKPTPTGSCNDLAEK
jgi:hypothetical protein